MFTQLQTTDIPTHQLYTTHRGIVSAVTMHDWSALGEAGGHATGHLPCLPGFSRDTTCAKCLSIRWCLTEDEAVAAMATPMSLLEYSAPRPAFLSLTSAMTWGKEGKISGRESYHGAPCREDWLMEHNSIGKLYTVQWCLCMDWNDQQVLNWMWPLSCITRCNSGTYLEHSAASPVANQVLIRNTQLHHQLPIRYLWYL